MYDVITIGSATTDVFVRAPMLDLHTRPATGETEVCFIMGTKIDIDELDIMTGGGATNTAATFASLGFKVATIASVGDDESGLMMKGKLHDLGISTRFLQTNKKVNTGYSIIILAGSGERTVLVHRGASKTIKHDRIAWDNLRTRWFYMSSLGGDLKLARRILDHAEKTGARIAWNPGNGELKNGMRAMRSSIRKADILLVNKEEARMLTGSKSNDIDDVFDSFTVQPKTALIITDGRKGSWARHADGIMHCAIPDKRKPKNTTGAGDAFGSGLVAGLLKKENLGYALAVGTWNATGVVMETGAKKGILSRFPGRSKLDKATTRVWK